MKHFTKQQVEELFDLIKSPDVYKKSGQMIARPAVDNETIVVLVGGKVETIKKTGYGDWIIRNVTVGSSGESYPVGIRKIRERYEDIDPNQTPIKIDGRDWFKITPKGMVVGGFYANDGSPFWKTLGLIDSDFTHDPLHSITFEAPWGGPMILENGDFLGCPYPVDKPDDIYRIARAEFLQTYGDAPMVVGDS